MGNVKQPGVSNLHAPRVVRNIFIHALVHDAEMSVVLTPVEV